MTASDLISVTALTELYNLAEHSFDHWTGAAGSEAV